LQLPEHEIHGKSGPVGPIGSHSVEHIGYGKDPRLREYAIPHQAARITTAIEPLVVLIGNFSDRKRRLKALQYIMTNGAVRLHDGVFVFRQSAWLGENVRGDSDLPNIMDDRCEAEHLHPHRTESESYSDRGSQIGCSLLVLDSERIAVPERC
jgi:hypothetical protein